MATRTVWKFTQVDSQGPIFDSLEIEATLRAYKLSYGCVDSAAPLFKNSSWGAGTWPKDSDAHIDPSPGQSLIQINPVISLTPFEIEAPITQLANQQGMISLQRSINGENVAQVVANLTNRWAGLKHYGTTFRADLLFGIDLTQAPSILLQYRSWWQSLLSGQNAAPARYAITHPTYIEFLPNIPDELYGFYGTTDGLNTIRQMDDFLHHGLILQALPALSLGWQPS